MKIKFLTKNRLKQYSALFLFLSFFLVQTTQAQNSNLVISGVISDSSDQLPIPGVNVIEKGTTNGTATDFDGIYNLKVSNNKAVIVITSVGYVSQTIALNGQEKLNIVLIQDTKSLEEVVVVGYGTSKKSDLTGAIATISGEDLKQRPMANVAETLTGRLAGVSVVSTEGSPDSDINIRVRGGSSLTQDASPLVIVDGFPVNNIGDIAPSNIETITVLKDASSTAIYGSRGANGVILITTKSGTKGNKIEVSYNTFTGVNKIAKLVDVLDTPDYVNWQYEYAKLSDDLPSFEDTFGTYATIGQYNNAPTTNWQKNIFGRTGRVQSHDLGIRGGSDKINYNFNYARYDLDAIMISSGYKRDNLSLSLKSKPNDKINLAYTIRYSNTEVDGGGANEQNEKSSADSRMKHVIGYAPIDIPGVTTDNTDEALGNYLTNPYVSVADNNRKQIKRNFNMLGGVDWNITKNLQFSSNFGIDYYTRKDFRFYGRSTYYVKNAPLAENQGLPALIYAIRDDKRFRNANTFNYDFKKLLGDDHKLKILLGEESINYQSNTLTTTVHGYPKQFTFDNAINLTTQGVPYSIDNNNAADDKLLSFFGRVNYDYKNRYLFTATFRADGSSKFLKNNRWGYFPSAAVAWKMSEEKFLEDSKWIDLLKLRLSYGQAGNNNIPVNQTVLTFQSANSSWIDGVGNYIYNSNILINPDLKWETTITQNLGLDYEFFKGRVSGSLEAYKNVTKDLLLEFLINSGGYQTQFRNAGEIQNTGFEASINVDVLKKENFHLDFSFNTSFNKNKVNSLGSLEDFGARSGWASTAIGNDFLIEVGKPVGQMYGYQNDGRYEVSDFDYVNGVYTLKDGVADASSVIGTISPGSMKLKDINGDGKVDIEDQAVIGNANPKYTGGFVINAGLHNFDFSAGFNFSVGNDIYNASKIEHTTATANNGQYRNLTSIMADGQRWTNIDPASGELVTDPAALTALNQNTTMWSPYMNNYVFSDWAVEDGSFLRLNTLTLGYSFPKELTDKLKISKLRLYTTASNVFVWTKYSGSDPEASTRRNTPLTPSVDYSPYPRSRQFILGLNLNF